MPPIASPGGRAFIVGTGHSINRTNLDLLQGEVTFGVNRVHLLYDRTPWRPTYWVYSDIRNQQDGQYHHDIAYHLTQGYHCFVWSQFATNLMEERRVLDPWHPNVTWIPLCRQHVDMDIANPAHPTSWHLPELCKFGSCSSVALQLAVLAGYNPIYVIGMDLGFRKAERGNDVNHFDPAYVPWDWSLETDAMAEIKNATHVLVHEMAQEAAAERGIEIFNATIGGELEVYPRVDYESLFD